MGDNVGDPFEDIDSEDDDLEKPPTPQMHDGVDSPDAPGFSDISDNEQEETTKEEVPKERFEDRKDSENENSPGAEEKCEKEDVTMEEKQDGSPIYDQEISPISSTAEQAEQGESTSEKGEDDAPMNEEESKSISAKISGETTPESMESKQEHSKSNIELEGKEEASGLDQSAVTGERTEDIHEEQTAGTSTDSENTKERRRRISSGAGTDDDIDMPISPLGLGLSGTESDLVEDILQGDVSKLLPDVKEDSKEESIGIHIS